SNKSDKESSKVSGSSRKLSAPVLLLLLLSVGIACWLTFFFFTSNSDEHPTANTDTSNQVVQFDASTLIRLRKTDPAKAEANYKQWLEEADAGKLVAVEAVKAYFQYADFLENTDREEEALAHYRKAAKLCEKDGDKVLEILPLREYVRMMSELVDRGFPTKFDAGVVTRLRDLKPGKGPAGKPDETIALSYYAEAALAAQAKDFARAITAADLAKLEFRKHKEIGWEGWAVSNKIGYLVAQRKFAEAQELKQRVRNYYKDNAHRIDVKYYLAIKRADQDSPYNTEQVKKLFLANDFEGLEKLVQLDQKTAKEVPLGGAYESRTIGFINDISDYAIDYGWALRLKKLKAWAKQHPSSDIAKLILADFLVGYAWFARGNGFADSVKTEQWKHFSERLDEALKVLAGVKNRTPVYYDRALDIALGQGWDRAQHDALLAEYQKHYPKFVKPVMSNYHWLLPRWFGAPAERQVYLQSQMAKLPEPDADMLYTCVGLSQDDDEIKESFKWGRLQDGFNVLIKRYPKSLPVRAKFQSFAYFFGDEETAKTAFKGIK
ncbi:MAG: DUF4034 domain-containing protein, partial [Candidatus Obscuribacterales bacterium]|nr:DUF4034 domain-containing protein [Candidatus Obscuribacterales bacterium]